MIHKLRYIFIIQHLLLDIMAGKFTSCFRNFYSNLFFLLLKSRCRREKITTLHQDGPTKIRLSSQCNLFGLFSVHTFFKIRSWWSCHLVYEGFGLIIRRKVFFIWRYNVLILCCLISDNFKSIFWVFSWFIESAISCY